jgi:hypothetical protein
MGESQLQSQNSWVPIAYCVRLVQMDLDDYTTNQYEKLLQYAILGYQDVNLTSMHSVKVEYLQMNDTMAVDLPSDYDDYYKIGMEINGHFWNLGLNPKLTLPREEKCGNDVRDAVDSNGTGRGGYLYTSHYRDGNYVGGLFGVGGGFRVAQYRIDSARRQIIFSSNVPYGDIVLEYSSNGISAQTLVPRKAVATVVAYMHWRRLKGKNRLAERREAKQEWDEEKSQLRAINMRFRKSEYLDMLHAEQVQTAKR